MEMVNSDRRPPTCSSGNAVGIRTLFFSRYDCYPNCRPPSWLIMFVLPGQFPLTPAMGCSYFSEFLHVKMGMASSQCPICKLLLLTKPDWHNGAILISMMPYRSPSWSELRIPACIFAACWALWVDLDNFFWLITIKTASISQGHLVHGMKF